jgi:hypothetical protein
MLAEPISPDGPHTSLPEVHSEPSRYDGSRTPPDVQYEIMRRHKSDLPISVIAEEVGCDPRTVKAVIQNWGTTQHTLRLQAHRSQVVDCLILGMHSAAEKGKLDSILSLSHTLGITEPVKGQHTTQVAVQVNLHGGPEPVSLAKVAVQSEGQQEQAQIQLSPIMGVMDTCDPPQVADNTSTYRPQVNISPAVAGETQEPAV